MENITTKCNRIMIVDDEEHIRELLFDIITRHGLTALTVQGGEEAIDQLTSFKPNLIILDYEMKGMNGLETLDLIRKIDPYVSVLFLTARSDTKDITKGLRAGADDYISKPFDHAELMARVHTNIRINNLTLKLRDANKRLLDLSETDDLTGLYNMRAAKTKIASELERGKRFKTSTALIMMDMDHFKFVNDDHDHLFGSYVLSEVGAILRDSVRSTDFGIRYGGDEFTICLTNADEEGTKNFCERIRVAIEKNHFKKNCDEIYLTVSVGYAVSTPGSTISVDDLMRMADRALYKSKHAGRNCINGFYEEEYSAL